MKWLQNIKVYFQSNDRFPVNFQTNPLSVRKMTWLNETKKKRMKERCLWISPEGKTDWWQRTFFEYSHDSAHFLYYKTDRNFTMETECLYKPQHTFDQGGLAVRVDSQNWIKVSIEFNPDETPQLASVVTNNGYSDASSQTLPDGIFQAKFRITRTGQDFLIEANINNEWQTVRLTHLHARFDEIACGMFAAAPKNEGFQVGFKDFKLWEV